MGMNYYLRKKIKYSQNDANHHRDDSVQVLSNGYVFKNTFYMSLDELNKHYYREYHIGKSSAGWHFLLGTYPEENINTLNDWKQLFENNPIYTEDGDSISMDEMINIIVNRPEWKHEHKTTEYAIGKRNLFKHTDSRIIDNNTDGTYDIIEGSDFS